jgi:hypothetical protein
VPEDRVVWQGFLAYGLVLLAAAVCAGLGRLVRLPAVVLALALGLALGRAGLQAVPVSASQQTLPGVMVHVAVLLGVLGYRLGQGMLRLRLGEILRRSLPPLALACAALAASAFLLPRLLPDAEVERSFVRFTLPLASVFAVFPLLALRDIRGRAPADAGSLFLVASGLVGAVWSFTPPLLSAQIRPGLFWRDPILVLGESGALGVAAAVVSLALARRARIPRRVVMPAVLIAATAAAFRLDLWPPFTALGFGAVLGRTGEAEWRVPHRALFSETPFVLLVALTFAPELFVESVVWPALLHALALAALLLLVRTRAPGGRALVTGPGLLFLGLTLSVRLDGRMAPITRYAVDFALPAWIILRAEMAMINRRARSSPTSTPHTA